jgi:hypothetical protein
VRNMISGFFFHALPAYMQGRAHALIAALVLPLGLLASALFLWWIPKDIPLEWVSGAGFVIALLFFWVKLKKNAAFGDSLVALVNQSVFAHDGAAVIESGGIDRAAAFKLAANCVTLTAVRLCTIMPICWSRWRANMPVQPCFRCTPSCRHVSRINCWRALPG